MLTEYVQAAMKRAKYEILPENAGFFGTIEGFPGVWANAGTLEECRMQLQEVLEDWILLSISEHLPVPVIDNIELKVKETV